MVTPVPGNDQCALQSSSQALNMATEACYFAVPCEMLTPLHSGRADYLLTGNVAVNGRDAPITHWPIIGRPIIGAKQSADYRLIQKVPETGQKPAVHTV